MKSNFYKLLLSNIQDSVFFLRKNLNIVFWNSGAELLTGFKNDEVENSKCIDNILICVDEKGIPLCEEACPAQKSMEDGQIHKSQIFIHHKEGYRLPVSIRTIPIFDKDGHIVGAAGAMHSTSPKVTIPQNTQELKLMNMLDEVTDLGDSRYLGMHLKSRLDEANRYDWKIGALLIDIDNFMEINDKYGRQTGDRILRMVGHTILNNIRFFDVVGRLGEDKFLVLIRNIDVSKVDIVANKIRLLVGKSNIMAGDKLLSVSVTIGGAISKQGDTIEGILNRARELLNKGKQDGKNRVCLTQEEQ